MTPQELAAKLALLRQKVAITPANVALLKEVQDETLPTNGTTNSLASVPDQVSSTAQGNGVDSSNQHLRISNIPSDPKHNSSDSPKSASVSRLLEIARAKREAAATAQKDTQLTPVADACSTLCATNESCSITESGNCAASANTVHTLSNTLSDSETSGTDKYGRAITFNEEQLQFIQVSTSGEDCILIGAAGTGKTTCMNGAVSGLIQSGRAGIMDSGDHKWLVNKSPGIVAVSFTRRAVSNLRKAMSEDMKNNCMTIHALLEYEPQYYTVIDEHTGDERNTMAFEPTRHRERPLPSTIRACIIDESSMVSVDLFKELKDALPSNCQFIFLGDIQQLPPVFGAAILGYKMLELKTVELKQVYRQALESPIIRLAHRILSGKPIPVDQYTEWKTPDQLTIHPWKKKITADDALKVMATFLTKGIEQGIYNPDEDMILIPFNKSCGTIELNKHIANFIARREGRITHEVIAGFNKHYFSVGDKVLYDKEDAFITNIQLNNTYFGNLPQTASTTLDYWGYDSSTSASNEHSHDIDDVDVLLGMAAAKDDEDRVRKASHIITVKLYETGQEVKLDAAAHINNLLMSYALTVHKSQGSEFRKVFLMLHQSHATMIFRELLYTAVTRAREELYIICEPETFTAGIKSQRIKGNTLAEKAEYFKGKVGAKEKML